MLWDAVYKVEMEITQEIWEVLANHTYHSQSGMVESLDSWWNRSSRKHVALQECENLDDQLLYFASLFIVVALY
jgi:hypothetical protein